MQPESNNESTGEKAMKTKSNADLRELESQVAVTEKARLKTAGGGANPSKNLLSETASNQKSSGKSDRKSKPTRQPNKQYK